VNSRSKICSGMIATIRGSQRKPELCGSTPTACEAFLLGMLLSTESVYYGAASLDWKRRWEFLRCEQWPEFPNLWIGDSATNTVRHRSESGSVDDMRAMKVRVEGEYSRRRAQHNQEFQPLFDSLFEWLLSPESPAMHDEEFEHFFFALLQCRESLVFPGCTGVAIACYASYVRRNFIRSAFGTSNVDTPDASDEHRNSRFHLVATQMNSILDGMQTQLLMDFASKP
jgi:hypothetical protein